MFYSKVSGIYGNILFNKLLKVYQKSFTSLLMSRLLLIPIVIFIIVTFPIVKFFLFFELFLFFLKGKVSVRVFLYTLIQALLSPLIAFVVGFSFMSILLIDPKSGSKKLLWNYIHDKAVLIIARKIVKFKINILHYIIDTYKVLLRNSKNKKESREMFVFIMDQIGEKDHALAILKSYKIP